jgi:hypothetical protein
MKEEQARRRRKRFLEAVNQGYRAARQSPEWQVILAERAAWDCALADGLFESEYARRQTETRKGKKV